MPYFDHVRAQLMVLVFAPVTIMKNLHQPVDHLSDSSILISVLRKLFLAFHEIGAPEEVLLCNHHNSFLLYDTL